LSAVSCLDHSLARLLCCASVSFSLSSGVSFGASMVRVWQTPCLMRSWQVTGQLEHLAGTQHADLEGLPGLHRPQLFANLRHVVRGLDRDAGHLEDDVAANDDVLAVDGCRSVAAENTGRPGRRSFGHGLHHEAGPAREVEDLGQPTRSEYDCTDGAPTTATRSPTRALSESPSGATFAPAGTRSS